jgi:hypothetical protein
MDRREFIGPGRTSLALAAIEARHHLLRDLLIRTLVGATSANGKIPT